MIYKLHFSFTILNFYKSEFPYMYIDARWSFRFLTVMRDYSCANLPFDKFHHSDKWKINTWQKIYKL